MFGSTKVLTSMLTGFAWMCFGAALVIAVIPAFYTEGSMRLSGSTIEEQERILRGRGGAIRRVERWDELGYVVRILDRKGTLVAQVRANRLPTPAKGESVKYFPPWPRLYVPLADYHYSSYLVLAATLAVAGFAVILGSSRLRRKERARMSELIKERPF